MLTITTTSINASAEFFTRVCWERKQVRTFDWREAATLKAHNNFFNRFQITYAKTIFYKLCCLVDEPKFLKLSRETKQANF
jgi:hypothetical protein